MWAGDNEFGVPRMILFGVGICRIVTAPIAKPG
jgi:hypothetical protein